MTSDTWRRIPGSSRLIVRPDAGRRARQVRALAGTSDWRRAVVDRLGTATLLAVGARSLPRAPDLVWPPVGHGDLLDVLGAELPGLRIDGAVMPRQRGRDRLSLLGRLTGNLVVVKLGGTDGRLSREGAALDLLATSPLPGIATPAPLAHGVVDIDGQPLEYLVTATVSLSRQRPAIDEPLRTFESDLAARLAALPRPTETNGTDHLVPVHGDLTPWNLRRTSRGLALFDWEAAGWGAPGSDLDRYRRASAEVLRPWWSRIGRR